MKSRMVRKFIKGWAILTVLWVIGVGWETYQNFAHADTVPIGTTGSRDFSKAQIIKIGAAIAFVPPALLLIVGVRLYRVFYR